MSERKTLEAEVKTTGPPVALGKRIGGYLYVHRSACDALDETAKATLSVAEELAGEVDWNVAKLSLEGSNVSLLFYSHFFDSAFPELARSYRIDLANETMRVLDYPEGSNRPVLHRKELLLSAEHPRYAEYAQLTAALERAGLLHNSHAVGYGRQWQERLTTSGYCVEGHTLVVADSEVVRERSEVQRHRTALRRYSLSRPMQALARHGYLDGRRVVFDYGCGRGDDLRLLELNGVPSSGWDPHFRPGAEKVTAPIVNLGFVINVIEQPDERVRVLADAFAHAQELLVVGVMLQGTSAVEHAAFGDGVLTSRGTFQKYFSQEECKTFIEDVLNIDPVPVSPGVFFVFRKEQDAQAFLEHRVVNRVHLQHLRQRIPVCSHEERTEAIYREHQSALDPLWELYLSLGRAPHQDEVNNLDGLLEHFGTLRRALSFLKRYHGDELIAEAAQSRASDLGIYLTLQLFRPRQLFSKYSLGTQRDIKAFFSSLRMARESAATLLYSIGNPDNIQADCRAAAESGIGCLDDEQRSLTLYTGDVERLSERLRVYVGCATQLYGDPQAADLIKIHSETGKLSLMIYDNFESKPLPLLVERVKLNFRSQNIDLFEYGDEYPSPYLYNKSRYVGEEFPNYEEQKEFEHQLAELELFDLSGHGPRREKFDAALRNLRLEVQGFELVGATDVPLLDEPCGKYHCFRDFVECGETQAKHDIPNIPKEPESYNALAQLAREVIDPVMDYFGGIKLTYGFCSRELALKVSGRNDPSRDQHAGYEYNSRGNRICKRLGAAVDFLIEDEDMAEAALWIYEHCAFDRLYFYGHDRPLHVSIGPETNKLVVEMVTAFNGSKIPKVKKEPSVWLKKLLKGGIR
ncbi:DNA phosphorothioation-associated putative methyltransferase [Halomonas sp. LR5S13]|uniref:DNA phosphorothioation-associated putative methyltransferase n=1 Tax=Halomonas rhizosphaerae TaxID=3043296 RepID=UPI0024A9072F|nr:DNA phosphorothioation-associated putative methyltransferase [Halomonas rhizosphaerae]MDI5922707.1 DNA phosphorothioation-associated putative methyltransferase [Halomonas rhizosphaerae]